MNHFPPPSPHNDRANDLAPVETTPPSRRRGGAIAALTAGVLIGGLVAGTQFASASTPSPADEPTPVDASAPDTSAHPSIIELDDPAWDAFEACLAEQLGDLGDLGDLVGVGVEIGDSRASVSVDGTVGDDVEFSADDLGDGDGDGDGDGTITITRVGADVAVATDGDVTTFDHDAFEADWATHDEAWRDAHEVCGDLLPDGAFAVDHLSEPFEMDGEFGDDFGEGFFGDTIDIGDMEQSIGGRLVDRRVVVSQLGD